MPLNEKDIFSFFKKIKCFEDKPDIAIGVSGGPDSMLLAYLLSKWIKLNKGKLYALIFDHGIRYNSKDESYQVKNMLEKLNIQSFVIKAKKNKLIKKNMANARDNRFEGLINFCKKNNIFHLFLGHHFDDNIETYLIRKINGSNLEGLSCMNDVSYFNNIQILRPLINISKHSILTFNKKNKIKFITDPSNTDTHYTRVKVRNFLQNKDYKKNVKNDFLNLKKKIPDYKKMIFELIIKNLVEIKSNKLIISFEKLLKLDELIIERHVLIFLKYFSNKKHHIKSSKIKLFIKMMKKPSFHIFNLSGIIIRKKSEFLVFSQK